MKTLEYITATACCGQSINDTGICIECGEHAGETYHTDKGEELSEVEVHAINVLKYWQRYASQLPKPMQGYKMLMNTHECSSRELLKAVMRVCDLYGMKTFLTHSDALGEFSMQVEVADAMTVFFRAKSKAQTMDPKTALFAA